MIMYRGVNFRFAAYQLSFQNKHTYSHLFMFNLYSTTSVFCIIILIIAAIVSSN